MKYEFCLVATPAKVLNHPKIEATIATIPPAFEALALPVKFAAARTEKRTFNETNKLKNSTVDFTVNKVIKKVKMSQPIR